MPNLRITRLWLAAAYAQLGRFREARAAADEVRRIEPLFTIERWKRIAVYKRPQDAERSLRWYLKKRDCRKVEKHSLHAKSNMRSARPVSAWPFYRVSPQIPIQGWSNCFLRSM
jgi:hypothetical protein